MSDAEQRLIEAGARVVDDAESRPSDYENVDVVAAAVLDAFIASPDLLAVLVERGVLVSIGREIGQPDSMTAHRWVPRP